MSKNLSTVAVILAGGLGTRMRSEITKQKMKICGRSILWRTVRAFESAHSIDGIVVVSRAEEIDFFKEELREFSKIIAFTSGGETRRDSAKNGFALCGDFDFVAIHDGARCMIRPDDIDEIVGAAKIHGAASAVGRINDTVKLVDADGIIKETVPRDYLRAAETPQVFSSELYEKALGASEGRGVTDDNMMAELVGAKIAAVETAGYNFKITTPSDVEYAEFLIERGYSE